MNTLRFPRPLLAALLLALPALAARAAVVEGEIVDAASGGPLPARVTIRGADGTWHFPQSAAREGSAVRYEKQRASTSSQERHTTLSPHPFRVELPAGRYTFTIERGEEFSPETRDVTIAAAANPRLTFRLRRWIDLASEGWFSGDTHVHRHPDELANVMLAEDVNVALPLLDWTIDALLPPRADPRSLGDKFGREVVRVDAAHAWHPRNTEYEIFRVQGRDHRLGALFILNHRTRFDQPVLPLGDVLRKARAEGAVLDLEKHNWPWTLALAPLVEAGVIELANNHLWSADYAVKNWAVPAPAWMQLAASGTDTERDWIFYGLHTYYALLNCGLRLAPTAGSASGVHPVPLGFSRVYVHLDGPFDYDAWMRGLAAGRSFVTTGPLLRAKAAGKWPGERFAASGAQDFALECNVRSEHPLEAIELIANGEIVERFTPPNAPDAAGGFTNAIATRFRPKTSGWIAWRCFESRRGGRIRFAHTAPWHFDVAGQPLRARRAEADWLVARVQEEIARSRGNVPDELIAHYERALAFYQERAAQAR